MKENVNTHLNTDKIMEFYRYEAIVYATMSNDDGDYGYSELFRSRPKMVLHTYNLHKETPKGYWIGYGHPDNGYQSHSRWVSKTAKKRYAYPTKEEALTNYIKRTERRVKILKTQLSDTEYGLAAAKVLEKTEKELSKVVDYFERDLEIE